LQYSLLVNQSTKVSTDDSGFVQLCQQIREAHLVKMGLFTPEQNIVEVEAQLATKYSFEDWKSKYNWPKSIAQANYMSEIKLAVSNAAWPGETTMVQLYRWCLEHPNEYDLWQRVFKAQHSCNLAWLKQERDSRTSFNEQMRIWTHVRSLLLLYLFLRLF
jgi:hypothetical protein